MRNKVRYLVFSFTIIVKFVHVLMMVMLMVMVMMFMMMKFNTSDDSVYALLDFHIKALPIAISSVTGIALAFSAFYFPDQIIE